MIFNVASLSTRTKRKGHQRVSFSFGDIITKPNVAPQAKGVAETGSHIRPKSDGELAYQRRDIFFT